MNERNWFWIRYNAEDGLWEICSTLFTDEVEAMSNQKTFKGERLCETVWG